ncbi:MAG: Gfo/Idh/MocA family oxidoreductase [Bacteroidota bacterium]
MTKKIRVGVVGVGHLGSLHAKMFSEMREVEFRGVFDIKDETSRSVASEFGVIPYQTFAELLENVDAISIATPTSTHWKVASKALETRVHAFIEKPLTQTVDEADRLVQLASQHNVKIQVGHVERFNPALLALEKYNLNPMFIESHRLAQFNPRGSDVPVVLDLMIHDIDIILSLVNSPVVDIDANGVAVVSDSADIANARIKFRSGCVANVTASRISQRKMRKMRLFQRDAYISIDFSEGTAEVFRLVDASEGAANSTMLLGQIDAGARKRNIVYERPEIKEINALKYELELFIKAIQTDEQPIITAEDGKRALQVAQEIMARIRDQQIQL